MIRTLGILTLAIFLGATAGAVAFVFGAPEPPSFQEVMKETRSSELVLLDRDGQILQESRKLHALRRLAWTPLNQIPYLLQRMVIGAEDRRFRAHFGLDVFAAGKAVLLWLQGEPSSGASTITMQLVGLINPDSTQFGGRRGGRQKMEQARQAMALESSWSKDEILEAYFNLLHFRGELQGVATVAQGVFGKAPFALTDWESAMITALIRAPNADIAKVLRRTCQIMSVELKDCVPPEGLQKSLSQSYWIRPLERLAPLVSRHLPSEDQQGRVTTSLRKDLQIRVKEVLSEQVERLKDKNLTDAAAVVLDNKTGQVLAYVGNVGGKSNSPHVDAAFAQRQAGSTLKPFIYGLALQRKLLTAASVLPDTPTDVAVSSGLYRPSNFDRRFREEVSARVALASSLNIPAVKVLESVGVENAVRMLGELGLTGLERADFYGPSLALGSMDVRLLELTNAYRALANQGRWTPVAWTLSEQANEARQVLDPASAFIVADILSDRGSRSVTFGWENALATRFWTAVKTGTSKDMRDNWCVGYSERFSVGVWAGNLSGEPMWNVLGVQGAAPAWLDIMNALHRQVSSQAPKAPDGLTQKKIRFSVDPEPFSEWFLTGTEPPDPLIRVVKTPRSRLTYPVDRTMVALDPDIPSRNQRIFFAVAEPQSEQTLRLNGKLLAKAQSQVSWAPKPGKYKLELVDGQGHSLDAVEFQVKGRSRQ